MEGLEQKTEFGIKLLGEMEGVDASTLLDIIGNFSVAIHQINEDINSNKSLKVTVKHLQPGCYDVFISLKETVLDPLFKYISTSPTTAGAEIVSIIAGIITIKKFLKGDKPSKITPENEKTVVIQNQTGATTSVDNRTFNIYTENLVIDGAISKTFDTINSDKSVEGLELYDSNKEKLCEVGRSEFEALTRSISSIESDTKSKTEEAILTVLKVVFEKGYKWLFYYQGNKISAEIADKSFFELIDGGAKFSKGDKLLVDLEITQMFDKSVQTYVNKEYSIVKMKQHILREEQSKMFNG